MVTIIKEMRKQVKRGITELEKSAKAKTASLKKPRSAEAQKRFDDKQDHQITSMEKSFEICEKAIMGNAHFTFSTSMRLATAESPKQSLGLFEPTFADFRVKVRNSQSQLTLCEIFTNLVVKVQKLQTQGVPLQQQDY